MQGLEERFNQCVANLRLKKNASLTEDTSHAIDDLLSRALDYKTNLLTALAKAPNNTIFYQTCLADLVNALESITKNNASGCSLPQVVLTIPEMAYHKTWAEIYGYAGIFAAGGAFAGFVLSAFVAMGVCVAITTAAWVFFGTVLAGVMLGCLLGFTLGFCYAYFHTGYLSSTGDFFHIASLSQALRDTFIALHGPCLQNDSPAYRQELSSFPI